MWAALGIALCKTCALNRGLSVILERQESRQQQKGRPDFHQDAQKATAAIQA